MRLKVTLRRQGDVRTDLDVTADASATVGDVATTLFVADPEHADALVPGPLTLHVWDGATSRELEPEAAVLDSGLRSGSTVTVVPRSERFTRGAADRGAAAAVLRVVAGPDSGTQAELPFGSSVIGRERDVDVRLTDPMVSKRHARVNVAEVVEILDLGSANGVQVGGQAVSRHRISPGEVVTLGDTDFTVVQVRRAGGLPASSPDLPVLRAPRVVPRFGERKIPAPEPPRRDAQSRFPWLALVSPLVMGVGIFLLTRQVTSLLFIAFSPVLMLASWGQARLGQRRAARAFRAAVQGLREDVDLLHEQERAVRLVEHPSTADALHDAVGSGPLLWTRRPEHPEFGTVRLGLGAARSRCTLELPQSNETRPEFTRALTKLAAAVASVDGVPVVGDLRLSGCLGVAGAGATPVAASVVAQLVSLHSPAELVLAALVAPASAQAWRWLAWLPHTTSPHSPIGGHHLAADSASAAALVAALEELVEGRSGEQAGQPDLRGPLEPGQVEDADPVVVSVVVLVDDAAPIDRARLNRLAEQGPRVGVHLLWLAPLTSALPGACRSFVEVRPDGTAVVGDVRWGSRREPVAPEVLEPVEAEVFARALAPAVDVGAPPEDDSDLPRSVSYLTVAGDLVSAADLVVDRWRQTGSVALPDGTRPRLRSEAGLRAVVGRAGAGPFHLDLRTQGPHALVGGTTGAGKSEFLQSWVLGMAAAYSPLRLTFLFVDYKGGAAFADCVHLPHCVGLVTDLTQHLVRRALTSLRAELRHRERVLERAKAKDLVGMERTGDPATPPALVIVVDEFAALVQEVPEFVDGMVDVAQRGRSLGLHLVLATQRPAGVIKDNLRANTNLRVALRMADADDSVDILGVPDAAGFDPSVPGRGAVKTGPGRIVAFQTGYAGGWTTDEPPRPRIDVAELGLGPGVAWDVPEPAQPVEHDPGPTDITRVVANVRAAAVEAGIEAPRRPWLPELAAAYDLSKLRQRSDAELALGVEDLPESQEQRTVYWRPDVEGNLGVYGTGGSGKSTVLRTVATSAAVTPRGGPVHVYALDFGSRGLDMLGELPHVGAVIPGDDGERVRRLLRHLRGVIDERAVRYGEIRAGSVAEYRTLAVAPDEPRILLLVDGVGAFRDQYDLGPATTPFGLFEQIAVDGRPVGVHVVVAADRPGSVPLSVRSTLQRRLVLRQADVDDYGMLDVPRDVIGPGSPPGRAVLDDHEVQVAVLGGSPSLTEQSRKLRALARNVAQVGRVGTVTPIRRLPDDVPLDSLPATVGDRVVLGLDDRDLSPWGIAPEGLFLVAGTPGSGRTTALVTIATALRRAVPGLSLAHLGTARSPLRGLPGWSRTAVDAESAGTLVQWLRSEATRPQVRLALIVEDAPSLTDSPVENDLSELLRTLIEHGHLVVAEGELSRLTQYSPLLAALRGGRRGIVLQPDQNDGDTVFRTDFPRVTRREFPTGRGIATERGATWRVQMARV